DTLRGLGYSVNWLDTQQFAALEPSVVQPPKASLFFPSELVVDAQATATAMLAASGARVLRGIKVRCLEPVGDQVSVITPFGTMFADQVVVAAGTATQTLLADFDMPVPLRPSPTFVLQTRPTKRVSTHVLGSPIGDTRQRADGVFIMPTDVKHQANDADAQNVDLDALEQDALGRLRSQFLDLNLQSAGLTLAHRPMPSDGLPIIGAVAKGVYAAVMHSGVTLGPVVGGLVAQEVLNGPTNTTQSQLAPYRPDRFQ
ncbi:MAG: FAD-dependent oxidoreductase, partial [Pseudomonadota bacterium]